MPNVKIIVYQLDKKIPESRKIIFMPYAHAVASGIDLNEHFGRLYEKVYEIKRDIYGTDIEILERLFAEYNRDLPEGFKGHTPSMSDVIAIDDRKYYCDAIGWKPLTKGDA